MFGMGTGISLNVIITRKLITNYLTLLNYILNFFILQVFFIFFPIFFILFKHTQKYIDEI